MKIRQGFVSNSSTSSFCIWGVHFDRGDLKFPNVEDKNYDEEDESYDRMYEIAEEIKGLTFHNSEYDGCYVGRSFSAIKDDETGLQFKQKTEKLVKEFFAKLGTQPEKLQFGHYEEAYAE